MARELNGLELQGFIKERQLKQVRNLRQEHKIIPTLLIIKSAAANDVNDVYIRMKTRYAEDITVEVLVETVEDKQIKSRIEVANADSNIHGIMVQLPLKDISQTEDICNYIDSNKDVDGLGANAVFPSATAEGIDWLLTGYNVALEGKHIAILGSGKLVGGPLGKMWKARNLLVTMLDDTSENVDEVLRTSDVIISAAGVPRLVKSEKVKKDAVVVDAGTSSEKGVIVGDVDDALRERSDLTITPIRGGVGPMTIAVLFDHVIEVCLRKAGNL